MTDHKNTHCEGTLPKLSGADIELGNFVHGMDLVQGTGYLASRLLLKYMPGVAAEGVATWQDGHEGGYSWYSPYAASGLDGGSNPDRFQYSPYGAGSCSTDWGRKFLAENGGCAYIDLNHVELCLPEVISAWDHVACWHAMLRMTRRVQKRINVNLDQGRSIEVLVNNSDGNSNSYGSHINFLVTRNCYDNIFRRKLHQMLLFASFLSSSIVYTGAGKVGSENSRDRADYQISQRADFFETLTGPQTTWNRPIVNSRDEALCGDDDTTMGRVHVIFFDNTLCHGSSLLKIGVTQIILAMLEQEQVPCDLILEDPLEAVITWSHDPSLRACARILGGPSKTAVEVQFGFLDRARRFVDEGRAQDIVPRAPEIIRLWEDTLLKLEHKDFEALAPRLDWALKLTILQQAMDTHPGLAWDSPQMKHLDLLYSSLDSQQGLYWIYEKGGQVEKHVSEQEIRRFMQQPPDDTRAWIRAMILRDARSGASTVIDTMDWDSIRFKIANGSKNTWPSYKYHTFSMPNPLAFTRKECEPLLERAPSLMAALESLGMEETVHHSQSTRYDNTGRSRREPGGFSSGTQKRDATQQGDNPATYDQCLDPHTKEGDGHGSKN